MTSSPLFGSPLTPPHQADEIPPVRFCALPETLTTEDVAAKWGKAAKGPLAHCATGLLPGVTQEQWLAALDIACQQWADVCGLTFVRTDTAAKADILHGVGPIDGSGKTLAWSELPNGADTRLKQLYDSGEQWAVGPGVPANKIDIVAVACHEIGHALGLGHDNAGGAALMDPFYSPKVTKPQARDIARIQALYGPPKAVPTTPPVAPPAGPPATPTTYTAEQAMADVQAVVSRFKAAR
ncbi:matrixin family metalloprotease [Limnoglobus roseus]|uniref:Karilysin n=1 Tax=Limnoglobus roseus TaxID=2598579 RepID=A0A5C1ALA6_9BACT|nr:matrixin family metalloprotease [Limnoglobus roseus]QEL18522.1 Karilysin [Limnoglobus roseus]